MKYTFLIGMFALFAFIPFATHAQQEIGMRVEPAIVEQQLDPGSVYSDILRATNISGKQQTYYVTVKNVKNVSSSGAPIFADAQESTGMEIAGWIAVAADRLQFDLQPGETTEVPFTITVPANATPGAHLGGIYMSTTPETQKQTGIGIGFQVGPIVNVRVRGDVVEESFIRSFSTSKYLYSKMPVTFSAAIENTGNVVIRPHGPVEVFDSSNNRVALLTMNDTGAAVLPHNRRTFEISWDDKNLQVGHYRAMISLVYGESARKTVTANVSFWILPAKLIYGGFGGIALLAIILVVSVRMIIRRKLAGLGVVHSSVNNPRQVRLPDNDLLDSYADSHVQSSSWLMSLVLWLIVIVLIGTVVVLYVS